MLQNRLFCIRRAMRPAVARGTLAGGALIWGALVCAKVGPVRADTATLKNGMTASGGIGRIASLNASTNGASGGEMQASPIVVVDDGLRRTFFPTLQLQNVAPGTTPYERIRIPKRVATAGKIIGVVGPVIQIEPFDLFGNRRYTMNTSSGALSIVQGITEVNPYYTKVEGLQVEKAYIWDMRIATNSIPRDVLSSVLMRQGDPKNPDHRLRIVRLYTQAERFDDARAELQNIIADFPALAELEQQVKQLRLLSTTRLLKEIERRREVGQHRLAFQMLAAFPTDDVAGEMLIKVRDAFGEYKETEKQGAECLSLLKKQMGELESGDKSLHARLAPLHDEIVAELNIHTLPRMADYLRLASDEKLTVDQKLAIAATGWLLGGGETATNSAVASSLMEVRNAVRAFLVAKTLAERRRILAQLTSLEGATPGNVAKLLANMKPPVDTPPQEGQEPGCFELTTPGLAEDPEIHYMVQLPPEYDPYRRYPCVVTLGSGGLSPKEHMQWWTGLYNEKLGVHVGQASRNGYIVLSPRWTKQHQHKYEYSAREHAAVLNPLRDACRRFSIDTDRVYLSGHSIGGDAAWDIGLSHPDLWAGLIPIVAKGDKYVQRYWPNGRLLPMYFVGGEMDGDKIGKNGELWDMYMNKSGYDVMVVDYLGRGHEHFQEDIHRIFEWMNLHRRDFFPKSFSCLSLRPWDNFFWCAEVQNFPARSMVSPEAWPPGRNSKPSETTGTIKDNNLTVKTGGDRLTVWLSPEFIDFDRPVKLNLRSVNVAPSLETLLEDVRTRGDRQHPFWAKIE